MTKLTIMMPCLNEELTLGTCITKANNWITQSGVDAEVLIADNGSTDRSIEIAKSLGARVVHIKRKGYGEALKGGFEAAAGDWVIFGDSDDSYDFSDLSPFVKKFEEGYELVMGNRFQGGIEDGAMPWKNRYIGNPALSWLARVIHNIPIGDFHCGLRGLTKEGFSRINLQTTGMELATEIVVNSAKKGLKIAEVPTTLKKDGRDRKPHLRPWRDGLRHVWFIVKAKFN